MGQVLQAGQGQITARQAAVKAGIPMTVPATTINKVCLSGLNTIHLADLMIQTGEADIVDRRRHGVDDAGSAPAAGSAGGLSHRRRHARRLDDVRRPLLRLRRLRHGSRHREVHRRRPRHRAATARTRSPPPSHERAAAAIKDGRFADEIIAGARPAAQGRPDASSTPTRASAPARRPRASVAFARPSRPTARSPPATPARSPTAVPRSS